MPFMFSDRDFIIRKKIWKNYNNKENCFLINIKSIDHSDYPPTDNIVRGKFVNRSAYICPDGDRNCKFYLAACCDVKVPIGVSLTKSKGSDSLIEWVEKFIENIKKHEG